MSAEAFSGANRYRSSPQRAHGSVTAYSPSRRFARDTTSPSSYSRRSPQRNARPYLSPRRSAPSSAPVSPTVSQRGGAASVASAAQHLSEELDVVRRAWRTEGGELRSKMLDVHHQKLKAEEKAFAAEAILRDCEEKYQKQIDSLHYEIESLRAQLRAAQQSAAEKEAAHRRREDELEADINTARAHGRDTSGRLGEAEARIETLRYELTTARGDADLYKAKTEAAEHSLAELRLEFEDRLRRFEEENVSLDTLNQQRQTEARRRETSLQSDLHEMEQRAITAETELRLLRDQARADRVASDSQLSSVQTRLEREIEHNHKLQGDLNRTRELYAAAQGEFQAVADAVRLLTDRQQ